jgi:hypothetical protein
MQVKEDTNSYQMNPFIIKAICLASAFFVSTNLGLSSLTKARIHPEKITFASPGDQIEAEFTDSPGEDFSIPSKNQGCGH